MKKHLRLVLIVTLVCCLLSATAISTFASGIVYYGSYTTQGIVNDGTMDLGQFAFSISSLNNGYRAAFRLSISIPSTFSKGKITLIVWDENHTEKCNLSSPDCVGVDYEISRNIILSASNPPAAYEFSAIIEMEQINSNYSAEYVLITGCVEKTNSSIKISSVEIN